MADGAAEAAAASRRELIKKGAAAAGAASAAWVAPSILGVSTAGAQTRTCYAFLLYQTGCLCQGTTSDTCDTVTGTTFNAAATARGATGTCPPSGTYTVTGPCRLESTGSGSLTVRSGCTIEFFQTRDLNGNCVTQCYSPCGTTSASWDYGTLGITNLNFVVCCTS